MANKLYDESSIRDIANAIREKKGTSDTYTVSEMKEAILSMNTGSGPSPTGTLDITANGVYDVETYAEVDVNITTSGEGGIIPSGSMNITDNGTYDVTNFASAVVNVNSGESDLSIGRWHTGTFTIEEDEPGDVAHTIVHGMGYPPTHVIVWADQWDDLTIRAGRALVGGHLLSNCQGHIRKTDNSTAVSYSASTTIFNITDNTFDFGGCGAAYTKPAGWTYRWFAM